MCGTTFVKFRNCGGKGFVNIDVSSVLAFAEVNLEVGPGCDAPPPTTQLVLAGGVTLVVEESESEVEQKVVGNQRVDLFEEDED
jgi:hypothetical protein